MEKKDVKAVHGLYLKQMEKHSLFLDFTEDQLAYYLLPQKRIVATFVVEDDNGELTDFMSFTYFIQKCLSKEEIGHE